MLHLLLARDFPKRIGICKIDGLIADNRCKRYYTIIYGINVTFKEKFIILYKKFISLLILTFNSRISVKKNY